MPDHIVDAQLVNPYTHGASEDTTPQIRGSLVGGVRLDDPPRNDNRRLGDEGDFYPLTVDKDGYLRVTVRADTEIETKTLEVLHEMKTILGSMLALLQKIS